MAADYYVATNGNDSRSCSAARSSGSPKQSINNASACLGPGDTLWVRGGTYYEMVAEMSSGTSWSAPVRIRAYRSSEGATPEAVWVSAPSNQQYALYLAWSQQYIELDGINLDGTQTPNGDAVKIDEWSGGRAHHIRLKNAELRGKVTLSGLVPTVGGNEFINLRVHGGGYADFEHGFYVQSSNNLIDGCEIWDFPGAGVHLYNDYGNTLSGNVVRNNVIRDGRWTASGQRHWGIIAANGASNTKIYNNLVYGIPNQGGIAAAIYVYAGYGAEVYNNTVASSSSIGVLVAGGAATSVINNIIFGNSGGNLANYIGDTIVASNLTDDPRFVNAGGGDFRLRSDSPAIDRGLYLGDIVNDLLGVARSGAPDIGAFEYGTAAGGGSGSGGGGGGQGSSPSGSSPDGTRVPSASSIVDASGAVWTITSSQRIMRNTVQTNGVGSQLLWYGGELYAYGADNRWWIWAGGGWALFSANDPSGAAGQSSQSTSGSNGVSADGTRIPSASSIVDASGYTWTLWGSLILRDGAQTGGVGSQVLFSGGRVYAFGADGNWWLWNGSGWQYYSSSAPAGGAAADSQPASGGGGTRIPDVSSFTDGLGAVWTLVNGNIRRNGAATGGRGSQVLLYGGVIYALGTDNNWWRWSGSNWSYYSAADPSTF